jgi:DNA-binding NarL/FixJ family response regulator
LLTHREIEVVKLIAAGCAGWEIAAVLALSEETVHTHTQHIMKKVDVHSAAKLVVWAREKGFG